MAPEHNFINEFKENITNIDEVNEYKKKTSYRSELDRISNQKEKKGKVILAPF